MKHLLNLSDLSGEEILELLNLADQLKYELKHGIRHQHLKGRTLGMIFRTPSTRTRVSFEVGMSQLGGTALFLSERDLQMGRGEPVKDTSRALSRYLDGMMIRTFTQQEVQEVAEYGTIPVINGLTDLAHPCQVLADLLTVREYKGALEGLRLCYVGDGTSMANSLIVGGLKTGMDVRVATPPHRRPSPQALELGASYGEKFLLTEDPLEAARAADVVCTDIWSYDTETEKASFLPYQVNDALLAICKKDVMVQHRLPAHRDEEITNQVFEAHETEIFDAAENRLHAQKAVLVKLLA